MITRFICSGFGGQGSLTIGKFLAKAAMKEGTEVSWLPSYGPEMRGGTANVAVVISDKKIASPLVINPDILVALNRPSVEKFGTMITNNGVMIANEDMCPDKLNRKDVKQIYAPMSSIAKEIGNPKVLNMVALGMIIANTGLIKYETLVDDLTEFLKDRNPALLEANIKAIKRGLEYS